MKTCTYRWLFYKNFFISAFTFGGGYVVIPMLEKYYVQEKALFTKDELMEMAAIAQSSPGAIALNLAVLSGYKVKGKKGALISTAASILPPFIIIFLISHIYLFIQDNLVIRSIMRGMEAGVIALIVDLLINMTAMIYQEKHKLMTLFIPVSFLLNIVFHLSVVWILLCVSCLCVIEHYFKRCFHE